MNVVDDMAKQKTETSEALIDEADRIFSDYLRRGESRPLYEKALEMAKRKGRTLETEYIEGKIDLIDKKWEEALKHFDEAITLKKDFIKAWHYKGNSLDEMGRYEEALACSNKALEIDPKYANAWNNKGLSLGRMGRYEEALACSNKALEIDPKNASTWVGKGLSLHGMGRYEEALVCSNKALEIDPKYANAWVGKGLSLGRMGRYEEALACFNKALEIDPKYASTWVGKGLSLGRMGRYEEALACFNKALEIDPKSNVARNNRNLALMRLGKFEEAEKEREKLYSEKKKEISETKIPEDKKKEKLLEIDIIKEVIDELKDKYNKILDAKKAYEDKLASSLNPRNNPLPDNFFLVLRRWNSYTPAMLTTTESNLGGGYFLYWKGKGIVIDPGFDFLDNFFNNKLVVYDIDAVILTHAHVDHCSDFESLLTLIFEYNDKREKEGKNKEKKKIDVFMNLGAMKKFLSWIPLDEDKNALINRVYSLEKGTSHNLTDYNLTLTVTKAIHNEVLSKTYAVGLLFKLYDNDSLHGNPFKIGYTSDTKHDEPVEEQYRGVDIIITHLGSIDENDFNLAEDKRHENHLMLKGVTSAVQKSQAKLAIISEFGEELGEHRKTIVGALNKVFQQNELARCLTGDIGLTVSIPDLKVKCHYCENYVDFSQIIEGIDPENRIKKSIVYYCPTCKGTYEYESNKNVTK